eukprot:2755351-Pleurochrysis_carterae.AAC.1
MMGMATTATPGGGVPARGVAQFAAPIGGEAQASAAVEAALLAAQAADEGEWRPRGARAARRCATYSTPSARTARWA